MDFQPALFAICSPRSGGGWKKTGYWAVAAMAGYFLSHGAITVAATAETAGAVFQGPVAAYEEAPLVETAGALPPGVLRWVIVEERMNVARVRAAVRVPVFFAAGECHSPDELSLVRWPSRESVAVQADDIRRGADGGVARLHLWFATDLAAGAHQRLALVKRDPATAPVSMQVESVTTGGRLQFQANGTKAVFFSDAGQHGALSGLQMAGGPRLDFVEGAGADAAWRDGAGTADSVGPKDGGTVEWGTGPVFAKVAVQMHGAGGSVLDQVFRLFADGTVDLIQTIKPSSAVDNLTLTAQDFLRGKLTDVAGVTVRSQSAGIVEALVDVHSGYAVDGIVSDEKPRGWMVVPGTLGGNAGHVTLERDGSFRVQSPADLSRGRDNAKTATLQAFWSQVSFLPAAREGKTLDRQVLLAASQPLVAVVERPGLTVATAVGRVRDDVLEMKPVGWVNESVVRSLRGKAEPFPRRNVPAESDPAHWVEMAQRDEAKVMGPVPRRLREDEKGRAAGGLDPYHITYDTTPLAWWAVRKQLPAPVRDVLRARLEAVRRQLARTDERGWPYLDVFSRAQNMQMGPPLLALADAGADPTLRQFYRDQLASPAIAAVALRGLRPYEGRPQMQSVSTDTLYQSVVDFMLRATELVANESFGLQRVAFGRYLDAIDVNADLYHPAHPRSPDEGGRFARANFFRTQSHTHRWLAWGPAPFLALLQTPEEDGVLPGASEAWQFANVLSGRWKNWPDQSWLFLATVLPERAVSFAPPPRPAAVSSVRIATAGDGNQLSWAAQTGAVAYRVYRMRPGLSPVWLNSPYFKDAAPVGNQLAYKDGEGKKSDQYLVHAIDAGGLESAW